MDITTDMIEQEHTAREYLSWAKNLISDFNNSQGNFKKARLRKKPLKELIEEALPVGYFTQHYYNSSDEVYIRLKIGNQNYDAKVRDERICQSRIEFIEVTGTYVVGASTGGEDYLFRLHLHNHNKSGTGKITKTGTKNTGINTTIDRKAISTADILAHEKLTIEDAIGRKSKKIYPENTALVISFDDTYAFDKPEHISNLENTLEQNTEQLSSFEIVTIVGTKCGLYIEKILGN